MKCQHCENPISADSRFCRHCGEKTYRPATTPARSPKQRLTRPRPRSKPRREGESELDIHGDPKHEQPVWAGRPTWRAFAGVWLVWAVLSLGCLAASYHYAGPKSTLVSVVWIFAAGAGVSLVVHQALVVLGLGYQLTTQRLFIHRGILTRVTDQTELLRIDDVRLSQGVIDRLVNTGSLDVFGTDETDKNVSLRSIGQPAQVAEALRLNVRAVRSQNTLAIESV
jgi:membrane protein YdbS with pleckstrin-like domain